METQFTEGFVRLLIKQYEQNGRFTKCISDQEVKTVEKDMEIDRMQYEKSTNK
ncbi:hypothetical protein GW940_04345 [Candidatus Microgenomates bacterium]|nr:hypothetical protein [Candidatus Microgenomates bacterium]